MDDELNNTLDQWTHYSNDIPNQMTNMWNFMLYNQFNNEEIRRLHREIHFLKQDKSYISKDIFSYKRKIDELNEYICEIRKKVKRSEPPKRVIRRKNILQQEYNKFKKNSKLSKMSLKEKNDLLGRIFGELNTISDIILLKDNKQGQLCTYD